jgi:hypothetical protein
MGSDKKFDVFISYKSQDEHSARAIRDALQRRGVSVWLDSDQIRPGDRFVAALESGIETSGVLALLATPASVTSGWVQDEYHRALALANAGELRLIPILLEDTPLPGFLSSRQHIDLRNFSRLEQEVDRLVWPGVTGKRVTWHPVSWWGEGDAWNRLERAGELEGIAFNSGSDLHRVPNLDFIIERDAERLVVVLDLFEGRPANTSRPRASVAEYARALLHLREKTKGTPREVAFVLFHQSDAWERVPDVEQELGREGIKRFQHYFTIFQDVDDASLRTQVRDVWNKVQRDLMTAERRSVT